MPRKGSRSEAAKKRWRKLDLADPPICPYDVTKEVSRSTAFQEEPQQMATYVSSRRGTGFRHRVRRWPLSRVTGRSHKLVIPAEDLEKKLALLVGDSHLRAIVDGFVTMPQGRLSFGLMSTPGASAAELRREVLHAVLPRTPEVVCVLAPSNNLTASRTITEAGADFRRLLTTLCNRWPNVVVLDFPTRLTVDEAVQRLLRQEYHRVAAQEGIRYLSVAEHFPLSRLELWCKDGVHLSDNVGMEILTWLLWDAASLQLQAATPDAPASPKTSPPVERPVPPNLVVAAPSKAPATTKTSPPVVRRVSPKLVVVGEVTVPRASNPFDWTLVQQKRQRVQGERTQESRRMAGQQGNLLQCSIPLNPVWFSPAVQEKMDRFVPACGALESTGGTKGRKRRRAASKKRWEEEKVCHSF
ncbi:uncharacterized protein [Paramormyrops kingsleyae]|uniref:uncharacterized protein n=1 Tax=Paramormyrops kingsleyae TaxID=1676925 RepID=UPI003B972006